MTREKDAEIAKLRAQTEALQVQQAALLRQAHEIDVLKARLDSIEGTGDVRRASIR
jgi:hypothetical protein